YTMKLIANCQLHGNYGTVVPGQTFETTESIGADLLKQGVVRLAVAPRIQYDTKMIIPREAPEVGPRQPFRDVSVPNEESAEVVADRDSVFSESDLLESGTLDSGGRSGRSRSTAGRR